MLHQAHPPASPSKASGDKLIYTTAVAPGADSNSTPQPSQAAQFTHGRLQRSDLCDDPFTQFHRWFTSPALSHHVPETVTLSTAALPSGRVSSRMVYLKELDSRGFVIYSNFGTSRKAADLASNSYASLCFWWKPLERQVRVEGVTERLSRDESQVYFDTRARGSRIGAWASQQTSVLNPQPPPPVEPGTPSHDGRVDDGRADLERRVHEIEDRFSGQQAIPVPPFWGGLRIVPDSVEFWQGRESRLHDRFLYTRAPGDSAWKIQRLSP